MIQPILAAGWEELFGVVAFVITGLFWVISHFAGNAKPKAPPPRRPAGGPPQPQVPQPNAPQAKDPLQTEIEEFLRQAQARREGKAGPTPRPQAKPQPVAGRDTFPDQRRDQRDRKGQRPPAGPKRSGRREEPKPAPKVQLSANRPEPKPQPRSLAEMGDQLSGSTFSGRAEAFSRMQEQSDAEFKSHMDRVFNHDVSTLKPSALGVFEAAGAAAKTATADALAAATTAAAGVQSATTTGVIRKQASDISLFLAGRKNMRDAIILSEILKRPEW
jgi:hypothetical protein